MRRIVVVWVGLALGATSSCGGKSDDSQSMSGSSSGEAGSAGTSIGGSGSGSAGDGGAGAMGGRDTTGGTGGSEAGTGGSEAGTGGTGGGEAGTGGVAGESPCECGEKSSDLEPTMVCTFPLELFCLEDDPFECATTLSEAHSHVEARCTPFQEEGGMLSNCADGTTELRWFEFGGDHQLVFDQNGVLVGRAFYGNSNHDFYENVCHGSGVLPDFMDYRAGVPPTWMCGPGCEICGDENACGQGGQPGGGGT